MFEVGRQTPVSGHCRPLIVEYLDGLAGGGRLVPADAAGALQARLWDRFFDGHVSTPMQKIVGDRLRPADAKDPHGVAEARVELDLAYGVLDDRLRAGSWAAGETFTLADCAAAPALFYTRAVHRWDEASQGHVTFPKMRLVNYDSATDYQTWETARIASIKMEPSLDDPWAEIPAVKPLGAAYSINSNRDVRTSLLAEFEGGEADNLISYLLSGRWDRSTISAGHQRYGQF